MKTGPSGFVHRMRMAGIAVCGAREADGERAVSVNRAVTCPRCLALIASRQAAAKARNGTGK